MDNKETVRHFLSGDGVDIRGRSLDSVLAWSDEDLESCHDFIQWLFPLDQSSRFNPDAPVLTKADFRELGRDQTVITGLRRGLERMLVFYGLEWRDGEVVKSTNWNARSRNWACESTHNDLRITRILHSLTLFGLHKEAAAFLRMLESVLEEVLSTSNRKAVLSYWRNALTP